LKNNLTSHTIIPTSLLLLVFLLLFAACAASPRPPDEPGASTPPPSISVARNNTPDTHSPTTPPPVASPSSPADDDAAYNASIPLTTTRSLTAANTLWQQQQTPLPDDMQKLVAAPYQAEISLLDAPASPPTMQPFQPVTVALHIQGYTGTAHLQLFDAHMRPTAHITTEIQAGQAEQPLRLIARGRPGPQTAMVRIAGGQVAGIHTPMFNLDPATAIHTGQADIDSIYPTVRSFMQQDVVSYELDGQVVRGYRSPDNPLLWLRDHVYQGRGFRYFEPDMTSLLDAFRRAQYADGSFPDVLTYPAEHVTAHRLEPESDLEYLFVQGVYDAWQATGDDAWLQANRQAMEDGIAYITSDPHRWDAELQLVRRPYTIDTWDFQYGPTTRGPQGKPSPRHWIDEQTVWGVFHGDNTGLAYALRLLQRIEEYLGNMERARTLHTQRDGVMQRLNALSWNGDFFTHFVLPDGQLPQVAGVDTAQQLSLSNALALNREVLPHEQGREIIETYHERRDFDRAFAEWYSIDPPFPAGSFGMGGGKGEQPGEYVNGGIMPLVGGELARGAFTYGAEAYGFDILHRYANLLQLTGASYLWYYPDGRPGISGEHTLATDGWGASAMLGALMEGAAGIIDKSNRYRDLSLNPRWAAHPDIRRAWVVARYAASDGYVAYTWEYDEDEPSLRLQLTGTWEQAHVRLLLPAAGRDAEEYTLTVDGTPIPFSLKDIGSGRYIIFDITGGDADVVLRWR
jgi:hypothetical protein